MKNIPMFITDYTYTIRKQFAQFKAIIVSEPRLQKPVNSRYKLRLNAKKYQRSGR